MVMSPAMDEVLHNQAMMAYDEAAHLEADAKRRFAQAAVLEERCLASTTQDEPRSRGVLLASAIAMWMRAGERARAEALYERYAPLVDGAPREAIMRDWVFNVTPVVANAIRTGPNENV